MASGSSHSHHHQQHPQTEAELSDPVLLSFRYAAEQTKILLRDTYKYCSTDDQRMDVIEKSRAIIMKLIKNEMKYTLSCAQIGVVMEELQNEEQLTDENIIQDVAKIEEICFQRAAAVERSLTEDKLKEHVQYKSLLELIERLEDERRTGNTPQHVPATPQHVEVEPTSGEPQEEIIPITDPITKQSLNDPVRNKHCGHIYGKAAILELVRKNPHIRCPTIGCSNRNYIKKSDMVYDPVLAAKVNKKQRDAAKKKIELQKQQQEQQEQRRHHHSSPRHRHHRSPN